MSVDADRVRACPGCGEIVPFQERTCPSCGLHDPLGVPEAASTPCPQCGLSMAPRGLYCGHCGRERELAPALARVPEGWQDEARPGADWLVLVLTLLGPLALLAAVLLVWL